ncbi:MAG: hypothetical protein KatS3mg081_1934 [Gemmatimonadales bacterium]|nr:hypothetical protein HRbin33_01291 [bacterium HR33]GIW52579.1 MAG: hypothetical protein KatS3mg081_1934 [Gemmatimonadales bacterium]
MRWFTVVAGLSLVACSGSRAAGTGSPAPVAPLPTAGLAGQRVAVYPLTMVGAADELGWRDLLSPRRAALDRADSVVAEELSARAPEVTWILPDELRRAARRGQPMLTDPDQMATALLRSPELRIVPDPLRSQMRALTAVAADRYALVPASLVFLPDESGQARAELTVVLIDVRTGEIGWRTVARGVGSAPWEALRAAIKALTPGLP